jgi:uncharacterized protein
MAALLDTNVLLALGWPNHQFHGAAHGWFHDHSRAGWATCAATELSFVRLSSNPAYTDEAVSPTEAADLLRRMCALEGHRFWKSPPARTPEIYRRAMGHQQVMDAWLVEAARQNAGKLVTFDRRLEAHDTDGETVIVIR